MYYEKTFLIISVLLGILFYPVNAQQRIVEGSNINISEVPWQVAIQTKGVFNGGGSILAPNLILTAAHVVENILQKRLKWELVVLNIQILVRIGILFQILFITLLWILLY